MAHLAVLTVQMVLDFSGKETAKHFSIDIRTKRDDE